jgi:hypothetical protein
MRPDAGEPAGERLEQLGAAGAHEPVEADDLAGADAEGHLVDGSRRGWRDRRPRGPRPRARSPARRARREQVVRVAADHVLDDPAGVDVVGLGLGDELPSRRTTTSVGDLERLLEVVRDVDDRRRRRGELAMTRKSTSTSAALSADVGSSMISTRASWASARAISTICCWPTRRSPTSVAGRAARRGARSSRGRSRCGRWSTITAGARARAP